MRMEPLNPPATDALLLDEIRGHLCLDAADDDAMMGTLARTAEAMMEAHLGVALVARDVAFHLDGFRACPSACAPWWQGTREGPMTWATGAARAIALPLRPLIDVLKVEIWQQDGWQEWASENYSATPGMMPFLRPAGGTGWPAVGRPQEGLRITARVGFGEDWNAVPATIRHAMLQLVAWLYSHRGDEAGDNALVASGAAAMVASYRKVRL